ncbi:MAG: hypothetical protein DME49_08180 [Verrucomicrobia bacterium]|nr:MAG: hypothetical protein DME49_08180 [Verrucomicrobiota bacterium]PYK93297.1 MAG: hypothetical protein DME36_10180 [Verrucomicrobiota bacterium]
MPLPFPSSFAVETTSIRQRRLVRSPIFLVEAFVDSSKVETTSLMTGGIFAWRKRAVGFD